MSVRSDRVGRSGARTYSKHETLNRFVGKEIGVINRGGTRFLRNCRRLVWIDLTAGDAGLQHEDDDWCKNSSPGILAHHARWDRGVKPVDVRLVEINEKTYSRLLDNLTSRLPTLGYTQVAESVWRHQDRVTLRALNTDGRSISVDFIQPTDAVLVLNDPNGVNGWAMRDTLPREISQRTDRFRSFSTIGWNVKGAKAWASREERVGRFDLIAPQMKNLARQRDLCLAWIDRDDAQWSYLLETPHEWREATEDEIRRAFGRNNLDVHLTWYRDDPIRFRNARMRMSLTKVEYALVRGREAEWATASFDQRLEILGPEVKRAGKAARSIAQQQDTLFELPTSNEESPA